jgi:hypothetical protein
LFEIHLVYFRDPSCGFAFQKCRQLFSRTYNESLAVVAMSVPNPDGVCPLESIAHELAYTNQSVKLQVASPLTSNNITASVTSAYSSQPTACQEPWLDKDGGRGAHSRADGQWKNHL